MITASASFCVLFANSVLVCCMIWIVDYLAVLGDLAIELYDITILIPHFRGVVQSILYHAGNDTQQVPLLVPI